MSVEAAPATAAKVGPEATIGAWVEHHLGGRVTSVRREGRWRPAWYVDVVVGARTTSLYVRGDRGHGFSYPLEREAATLRLFEQHGVAVPHVHGVMEEPKAIVMDKVTGDRQLSGLSDPHEQASAMDAFLEQLVRIHAIPLDAAAVAGIDVPDDAEDIHLVFHRQRSATYRRLKSRPEPLVEFVMKWLGRHVPTYRQRRAVTTVDAGQFLMQDGRVSAVYDLELVHVTDPQADLAGLRVRNVFEPLGDLSRVFRRYTELTGDIVDRSVVNFHTAVFALAANQAIARIRTQSAADYVQYFTWEVSGSLMALSAVAEELGVVLTAPQRDTTRVPDQLTDSLASALRSWTPPDDVYDRSLALDMVEHLRLRRTLGPRLEAEYVADVTALVGRAAGTAGEADAFLEHFVLGAGPEYDLPILQVLLRRVQRHRQLVPAMTPETSAAGSVGPHLDRCYLEPVSSLLR